MNVHVLTFQVSEWKCSSQTKPLWPFSLGKREQVWLMQLSLPFSLRAGLFDFNTHQEGEGKENEKGPFNLLGRLRFDMVARF